MTDSEMRATVQATFMMLQRLIFEVAAAKGEEGLDWIDGFRDSLTSEMKKVEELQKRRADTERTATSRMLTEGVALMAKRELEQQRSSSNSQQDSVFWIGPQTEGQDRERL
jgi:hypothetical protein